MTIDPMNAPILGNLAPADPPRPIRLATTLLLANLALAAGYRLYTAVAFGTAFAAEIIPLVLAVALVLGVRAARGWARATCTLLAGVSVVVLVWLAAAAVLDGASGVIEVVVLGGCASVLAAAIRLMWRPDVEDYFSSGRAGPAQPNRSSG
jgi:hypothetical protein